MSDYFDDIHIIQIGAGGTGSWLVPLVSKLINNIRLRISEERKLSYSIIDPDSVEERNIIRQNFTSWDIGKNKAQALVNRYSENFPDIRAINLYIKTPITLLDCLEDKLKIDFTRTKLSKYPDLVEKVSNLETDKRELIIFLGCVDNNKTRRIIYSTIKKIDKRVVYIHNIVERSIIYIDSGNSLHNGQIVSSFFNVDLKGSDQVPINFMKMFPLTIAETEEAQSCAFFGDQSQCVNNLAASLMFANLQRILINNELPPNLIEFSSTGFCHFKI